MWKSEIKMFNGILYYQRDPIKHFCRTAVDVINQKFDFISDLSERNQLLYQLNKGSDLPMWRVINTIQCDERLVSIHFYHDGHMHHLASCHIIYGFSQSDDIVTLNDINF